MLSASFQIFALRIHCMGVTSEDFLQGLSPRGNVFRRLPQESFFTLETCSIHAHRPTQLCIPSGSIYEYVVSCNETPATTAVGLRLVNAYEIEAGMV